MSLILPSTSVPTHPGSLPSNAAAPRDGQGPNNQGSFGEVLSRSLEPTGEITEKTTGKAAKPASARRPTGDQKIDPADLVNANAMTLPFVPLESRGLKATSTGGAATAPDNTALAAATAPPTDLLVTAPVPKDGSIAAAEVSTLSGAATAPLSDLLVSPDGLATATEVNTDTGAQITLESALATVSQKDTDQATLRAKLGPVGDSSAIQLDPGKIVGQPTAPDAGSPDQSSKRAAKAANRQDEMTDVSADLTSAPTHSAAKVIASAAAPSVETVAMTITGGQAPTADTSSASAALPFNPVSAAAQSPAGVSASNAAAPVITPPLTPEVGSGEWGKALSQQVVQMGKAGHQVAELQLNPPGLGPLKITLSMNDHQVQAMFVSAHSSVRIAVEAALPQLRTTLADNGISLGNTSVSSDSQQQTPFAQSQSGQPDHRSYRASSMVETTAITDRPVIEPFRRGNGITVDTYA